MTTLLDKAKELLAEQEVVEIGDLMKFATNACSVSGQRNAARAALNKAEQMGLARSTLERRGNVRVRFYRRTS